MTKIRNLWEALNDEHSKEWKIKLCSKCKQPFPISEYPKNSSKPCGHDAECKGCASKRKVSWNHEDYIINKESRNEQRRIWRKNNPEREKATAQKWRNENREKRRAYERESRKRKKKLAWEVKSASRCNKRARDKGVPSGMKPADLYDSTTGKLPEFCPIFPHIRLDYSAGLDMRCWASVDRKVPELGYVSDNVWVVSMAANIWKSNGSNSEERKKIVALMSPKIKKQKVDSTQASLFD